MTDAEYVFHLTNRERKRNGNGDYHKKRRGGRNVHLNSDYLTRKEWEKMNGEILTVELDQPRTWEQYKQLSDNYKSEYLTHLHEKYQVTPTMLARMLGVSKQTIYKEKMRLGLRMQTATGRVPTHIMTSWGEFLAKEHKATEVPPIQLDFDWLNLQKFVKQEGTYVDVLRKHFGAGVKVTIELTT